MRYTAQQANQSGQSAGGTGFVIGAMLCAATMVALFALHGAPDLLAGKIPALTPAGFQSP